MSPKTNRISDEPVAVENSTTAYASLARGYISPAEFKQLLSETLDSVNEKIAALVIQAEDPVNPDPGAHGAISILQAVKKRIIELLDY